jgi:hypothetical protein
MKPILISSSLMAFIICFTSKPELHSVAFAILGTILACTVIVIIKIENINKK